MQDVCGRRRDDAVAGFQVDGLDTGNKDSLAAAAA